MMASCEGCLGMGCGVVGLWGEVDLGDWDAKNSSSNNTARPY